VDSEKVLLDRARKLDQEGLAEIYDRYSPGIYRYSVRLLGNTTEAEECVAETFCRFLHALSNQGGPRDHLQAYLYRISHNWINDQFRRQPPPPLELEPDNYVNEQDNPHSIALQNIEKEKVRTALRLLTPDQRIVIVLKFFEGWSNEEIAQAVEKPLSAVKSLQHRGLEALRRMLIMDGEENDTK
jgi:RNA polymerase sigma-70 factor (ECF subfamily)